MLVTRQSAPPMRPQHSAGFASLAYAKIFSNWKRVRVVIWLDCATSFAKIAGDVKSIRRNYPGGY